MFPLAKLLISIATDEKSSKSTLKLVRPMLEKIRDNEYVKRTMISDIGVKTSERIVLRRKKSDQDDEYECEMCSENLYVSYVCDLKEDTYYCLEHALQYLQERKANQRKNCKLFYTHSKEEISQVVKDLNRRLNDSALQSSSSDEDDTPPPKRIVEERKPLPERPAPLSPCSSGMLDSPPPSVCSGSSKSGYPRHNYVSPSVAAFNKLIATPSSSGGVKRKNEEREKEKKKMKNLLTAKEEKKAQLKREREEERARKEEEKERKMREKEKAKAAAAARKTPKPESPPKKRGRKPGSGKTKKDAEDQPVASGSGAASSSKRRTKSRQAAHNKSGNLAVELLDMLLSESDSGGEGESAEDSEESSDEAWK